jgi:D-glycero-D-manno-heptose 1,7-bisphosphate phosphatase
MEAVKLYIFDVDGTLRFTTVPGQKYPLNCHQWRLMPHVAEVLRNTRWDTGRRWLAVCSNQLGVGDRYLSRRVAWELIQDTVAAAVGYLPAHTIIAMCTCPEGASCPRMKPNPGMLQELLRHYEVTAAEALYVGDQPLDAEAARGAGVPFKYANEFFGWQKSEALVEEMRSRAAIDAPAAEPSLMRSDIR